jgi:hypothetical protein
MFISPFKRIDTRELTPKHTGEVVVFVQESELTPKSPYFESGMMTKSALSATAM